MGRDLTRAEAIELLNLYRKAHGKEPFVEKPKKKRKRAKRANKRK